LKRDGQTFAEFLLATLVLTAPLGALLIQIGGSAWRRAECSFANFRQARSELIRTKKRVKFRALCNGIEEKVDLLPLEHRRKGDSGIKGSSASLPASRFWSSSGERDW
jgi:hypothetical protein